MPDVSNEGRKQPDPSAPLDEDTSTEEAEDVGRTTGGGSLGHDQPEKVKRDTPVRNATGDQTDPVMPADDATLKTKI